MAGANATASIRSSRWAIDFANGVACPGCRGGDALASLKELRAWARRHAVARAEDLSSSDLSVLRRFRSAVRQALEARVGRRRPTPLVLELINRSAADAPELVRVSWHRGVWTAVASQSPTTAVRQLKSVIARSAVELLSGVDSRHLRRCAGPGCIHFLVASRPAQRWCSPTGCGNRARVQRHYRKVHPSSPRRPRTLPRDGTKPL